MYERYDMERQSMTKEINIEDYALSRWQKWEEWKDSFGQGGAGCFAIGRFPNFHPSMELNLVREEVIYIGRTNYIADTLEKVLFEFQYKVLHQSFDKVYKGFNGSEIRQELYMLYAIVQPVVISDIKHRDVVLDFLEASAKMNHIKRFGALPLLN